MQCQGECHKTGECAGEVQKVTVSGFGISGWSFAYCETAIEIDRSKGFAVVLEAEESQQEQVARLRDEAEQDQDDEDPFGEHWHNLMMQHTKTELIAALKTALERAEKSRRYNVEAIEQNNRLWAENKILSERLQHAKEAHDFDLDAIRHQ